MDDLERQWRASLRTRLLWHAPPLHYVPAILASGALCPKADLTAPGILPRRTAKKRDGMMGLTGFVHFSLTPATPLLRDKLRRGYPHALFAFDGGALADLPHALLPYNTKAWRSRCCYAPVTHSWDKLRLLRGHDEQGRFPSLEFLARGRVPLGAAARIVFATDIESNQVAHLAASLDLTLPAPLVTDDSLLPPNYHPATGDAIEMYFEACRMAGRVLPPPEIAFD